MGEDRTSKVVRSLLRRYERAPLGARVKGIAAVAFLAVVMVACLTHCFGLLDVRPKESLEKYTWVELQTIAHKISEARSDEEGVAIAKRYHLCRDDGTIDPASTKTITLTGDSKKTVGVRIVGFRHDFMPEGGVAGITFCTVVPVTTSAADEGGTDDWTSCALRSVCAGLYVEDVGGSASGLIPHDVAAPAVCVTKQTAVAAGGAEGGVASARATDEVFFPLSAVECLGPMGDDAQMEGLDARAIDAEGSQYQLFEEQGAAWGQGNAVLSWDGSSYWLRSFSADDTGQHAAIDYTGGLVLEGAGDSLGVVVGFCY